LLEKPGKPIVEAVMENISEAMEKMTTDDVTETIENFVVKAVEKIGGRMGQLLNHQTRGMMRQLFRSKIQLFWNKKTFKV